MKDLNYVSGDLNKGKNLDNNLPKYANSMMSMYNGLSYIKMSMNYYTYFDMANDASYNQAEFAALNTLITQVNDIIRCELVENCKDKTAENIEKLDAVRQEVVGIMDVVTSYVDKLRIYEHVLNRIEYRFKDAEFDADYYNNHLTNDLMHYILADKDSMVTNSKISEIVGQLPMRLSRAKFYEYLRDTFTLYKGAQIDTIKDYVYSLRTVAMLDTPEGFATMFPAVYELYHNLETADYRDITKEAYDNLSGQLQIAAQKMSDTADVYVMFTQIINDLYTILLAKPYAFQDVEETMTGRRIIAEVLKDFTRRLEGDAVITDGAVEENFDDLTNGFISFEGKQERIVGVTSTNDFAIEFSLAHYAKELEELGLLAEYEALEKITKLQSGSDFVALTKEDSGEVIAEDAYVEKACEDLIADFDTAFRKGTQLVNRAVMATVLSQVPVFFNSVDEIQSYINTSLMQCSDEAEKAACVEVLKIVMQG